ncbi:dihydrodipicolinate synthase family protein [Candidatus Bipolaricaulota bacterium]
MLDLAGIYPPILTPFDVPGKIDRYALQRNLEFLGDYDLHGYVVLGSNGEAVHLSTEERAYLIEVSRELIPESQLLIVGTGSNSTIKTVELSQRASTLGADAVLVLPPYYYRGRMTLEALTRHFHVVANACDVPVIIYNMPACTGLDMGVETICALAEHPNIVGLKDSSGDIAKLAALHRQLGTGFQILAGSASFLLPALSVGAVGGVLALANIAPDQCLAIRDLASAGKWDQAREIQVRLIEANTAVTRRWGVAGLKAAMDLLDHDGGSVRAPLLDLEETEIHSLEKILIDSQILKPKD